MIRRLSKLTLLAVAMLLAVASPTLAMGVPFYHHGHHGHHGQHGDNGNQGNEGGGSSVPEIGVTAMAPAVAAIVAGILMLACRRKGNSERQA